MEEFLSLNTLSFLHSHSDQIKAIAPTLICFLNLLLIPFNQFPKILVILHGRNKVEATWMTDHIDLAIGRINVLLFYFDDKKHISYFHANSVLQDYL
jgi:hypothetical protein